MDAGETELGGTARSFPSTVWSQILSAADPTDARAREHLGRLLQIYWKPVYAYVRLAWHKTVEDAKDLTQSFFALLLEKGHLGRVRPERGSFRGYLKTALKHFLINAEEAAAVRRGRRPLISLDAPESELERLGLGAAGDTPERAYDREWFRALFEASLDELRSRLDREGKALYFEVFRNYCFDAGADARGLFLEGRDRPDGAAGPAVVPIASPCGGCERVPNDRDPASNGRCVKLLSGGSLHEDMHRSPRGAGVHPRLTIGPCGRPYAVVSVGG
ncbi:MAG: sigma-70 family RNA polymerase sigma factor [Planctomycetes bacterium]|nr:sigma-70 family RNA polymerase sigma factor [Planctomycetota bacterium]